MEDRAAGVGPAARVLVVGYGNPLRSDDGVGRVVAEQLMADPRLAGAEVRTAHQLTPELALDASEVDLLVLIDAADGVPPGEVVVRDLAEPGREGIADGGRAGRTEEGGPPLTHHVDPASIVELAATLWGAAPRTIMVGVGPASFELGEALTPVVAAAVPMAVEAVVAAVVAATEVIGLRAVGAARAAATASAAPGTVVQASAAPGTLVQASAAPAAEPAASAAPAAEEG